MSEKISNVRSIWKEWFPSKVDTPRLNRRDYFTGSKPQTSRCWRP